MLGFCAEDAYSGAAEGDHDLESSECEGEVLGEGCSAVGILGSQTWILLTLNRRQTKFVNETRVAYSTSKPSTEKEE